jgi:hypothetical protein
MTQQPSEQADKKEPDVASLGLAAAALVTAITATSGVLTVYGVNSERAWALLDDNTARWFLWGAGVCSIVAVTSALASYLRVDKKRLLLGFGTVLFLVGLLAAMIGAGIAANVQGRPAIVDLAVVQGASGPSTVTFDVVGSSVDDDERLGVRLIDPSAPNEPLVEAYPRPTAGKVQLKVELPVSIPGRHLTLQVWSVERWTDVPKCPQPADESTVTDIVGTVIADCVNVTW